MSDEQARNGGESDRSRDRHAERSREAAHSTDETGHRLDERGERRHENEGGHPQHARKGQAQSPVEETHHEPPKQKEGHR